MAGDKGIEPLQGDSKSPALPLCKSPVLKLERVEGIEPSHRPWQGHRLPLHHTRINWWTRQDSNLPHSACKADALPNELLARKMAEGEGAAPSVVFRPRQFSKLLRLTNYSSTFHELQIHSFQKTDNLRFLQETITYCISLRFHCQVEFVLKWRMLSVLPGPSFLGEPSFQD